jgi:hypothetical protein
VFDHVNQCMTFGQLIEKVHNHSELYHLVFERSKQLINLVDVVPKT